MSFNFLSLKRVTGSGTLQKEVDGLRFVAIVPVVLMHAYFVYDLNFPSVVGTGGFFNNLLINGGTGVHLFFVISGYILSYAFYKAAKNSSKVKLKNYYYRRLQRLEPPYIITLIGFMFVLILLGKGTFSSLIDNFVASIFYVHNIIYGHGSEINNVAWTLEVEFQFYVLAPLLYYLYKNEKYTDIGLLLLIFAFLLFCYLMGDFYRSILSQGHFFLLGAIFHGRSKSFSTHVASINPIFAVALFVLTLTLLFSMKTITSDVFDNFLKLLFFYVIFMLSLFHPVIRSVLSIRGVYLIGGICYSIYLLHYPLLSFVGKLAAGGYLEDSVSGLYIFLFAGFLIVIAISIVFALFFERPFMVKNWPSKLFYKLGFSR